MVAKKISGGFVNTPKVESCARFAQLHLLPDRWRGEKLTRFVTSDGR